MFRGKVDYKKLFKKSLTTHDEQLLKNTNNVLSKVGQQSLYPNANIKNILATLGESGLLGMIIDKKYNGNRVSIQTQSKILTKISSYNPALGVVVMTNKLYKYIISNQHLEEIFRNDIYYQGTVLEKMETLESLAKNSPEYEKLYQDIISVGEFKVSL